MKGAFPTGTEAGSAHENKPRFTPPTVEELIPHFPQLEILAFVGQGGMGAVYKARQKQLDRIVALKILPPGIGDDPSFAERFAREAKALAKLDHPGIVTIHDFGRADGLYFFVMEFVDGVDLRRLLQAGRVSPREALAIVPQICDALQFAHDQGIVHRDIKPENILLDRRGRVKVADFGLAKLVEGGTELAAGGLPAASSTALTESGKIMGTPQYMAPEQVAHPLEVDHRADIYSLGVVFYQMLTGELPGKKIEPPSSKVQIDVRLDEVVLRALEKNPELRYQQVSEVKTCVETIATTPAGKAVSAIPSSLSFADEKRIREQVKAPAIGLLVAGGLNLIALLVGAVGMFVELLFMHPAVHFGPPVGHTLGPMLSGPGPEFYVRFGVFVLVVFAVPTVFILLGAFRMRRLETYGLAVAASILAMMIPPGFLLGIPFGIWSLIVLLRSEVRNAFAGGKKQDETIASSPPPGSSRREETPSSKIATAQYDPWEIMIVVGATIFLVVMFFVTLGIVLEYPRQAGAPLIVMGMCVIGLVICAISFAGLWPFPSPLFPKPNFSSRHLPRGKYNPWEIKMAVGATIFIVAMFFVALGFALEYPRQAGAPLIVMGMCVIGLSICGLILAGLWPFASLQGPTPNFSSRNLARGKSPDATPDGVSATPALPETPLRFSRTAIVGVCWLPLFFLSTLLFFITTSVPVSEYHGPAWWQNLLRIILLPTGFTAPFGMTILGWIAVAQIRRSAGKLYGMWLALFDGLLFPLLALDGLILGFVFVGLKIFVDWVNRIYNYPFTDHFWTSVWVLLTVIISALVDFVIIRLVWRAVNKVSPSTLPANPPTSTAPAQIQSPAWKVYVPSVFAVLPMLFIWFCSCVFVLPRVKNDSAHYPSEYHPFAGFPLGGFADWLNEFWTARTVLAVVALVILAELFLPVWRRHRRRLTWTVVALVNSVTLLTLVTLFASSMQNYKKKARLQIVQQTIQREAGRQLQTAGASYAATGHMGPVVWHGDKIVSRILPDPDFISLFIRLPIAHAAATGRGVKVAVIQPVEDDRVLPWIQTVAPQAEISNYVIEPSRIPNDQFVGGLFKSGCRIAMVCDLPRWPEASLIQLVQELTAQKVLVVVPSDLSEEQAAIRVVNKLQAMGCLTVGRVDRQSEVMVEAGPDGG